LYEASPRRAWFATERHDAMSAACDAGSISSLEIPTHCWMCCSQT